MLFDVVQKMEEPTIDERKRWWLLCYGMTSMEKALSACDLLLEHCPDNRHPLFQPLSVAVHAYYVRPFKRNRAVGKLPETMIPASSIAIHHWLEDFRDSVMAHIDADHNEVAGRPMNDVIYTIEGAKRRFTTCDPRGHIEFYVDARAHIDAMFNLLADGLLDIHKRFGYLIPDSDGDYLLSLADDSPVFIEVDAGPIQSVLTYK